MSPPSRAADERPRRSPHLIAAVGQAWCFTIDAISYVAVIASLLAMRIVKIERTRAEARVWEELSDGFRYVTHFAPVRESLLLLALVGTMAYPTRC